MRFWFGIEQRMHLDRKSVGLHDGRTTLRFFGIELRIVFCLLALVFGLIAWSSFQSSPWLNIIFLVIFALSVLFIWLDYSYHVISLTSTGLAFRSIKWKCLGVLSVSLRWNEVEQVTTNRYGYFGLFKSTKVEGKNQKSFLVFSFMEDYLHFLKEIVREAKSAGIDKLTLDLAAGRADVWCQKERPNRCFICIII